MRASDLEKRLKELKHRPFQINTRYRLNYVTDRGTVVLDVYNLLDQLPENLHLTAQVTNCRQILIV